MQLLWFLIGFGVGLACLGWRYARLNRRLRVLLEEVRSDSKDVSLSVASQLSVSLDLQRRRLQQLEQQLEAARQTLYVAPIGYLQVDEENRLIFANPQACGLLGFYPPDTTRTRLLLELVRSFELDCLIEQARQKQIPCRQDWSFHRVSADPTKISRQPSCPLRGYAIPLPEGHVGIFLEDRQEAIMLTQQRDRWASDVAHELKTPLTSIRLVAETLRSRIDPALVTWIDRLLNETIRLSNLVQDLLDLSKIERGAAYALNKTPANLPDLVQRAWLSLEPLAAKKQLQLDYVGPEKLFLAVDEPRMFRVLINLMDNGIQHSPPRSVIQVQLAVVDGSPTVEDEPSPAIAESTTAGGSGSQQIQLDVIDAGSGFREEDLPYVFERFYRSDAARARSSTSGGSYGAVSSTPGSAVPNAPVSGGSGLGLAIVRQIVVAHQGTVTAQNHPETGGGWLRICLPYQAEHLTRSD